MKKYLTLLLFSFVVMVSVAQNQQWIVASSTIKFKIKNAGIMIDGAFTGLNATINFDTSKGFGNKIEASVDAKTVNTGNDMRDEHLRKVDYFSVDQFPKIFMKSSVFSKEADGRFKGFFTLTIKGVSNTVPVIFSFTENDGKGKLSGSFKINRLDYKVGGSSWVLSDDVNISLEVNVVKK